MSLVAQTKKRKRNDKSTVSEESVEFSARVKDEMRTISECIKRLRKLKPRPSSSAEFGELKEASFCLTNLATSFETCKNIYADQSVTALPFLVNLIHRTRLVASHTNEDIESFSELRVPTIEGYVLLSIRTNFLNVVVEVPFGCCLVNTDMADAMDVKQIQKFRRLLAIPKNVPSADVLRFFMFWAGTDGDQSTVKIWDDYISNHLHIPGDFWIRARPVVPASILPPVLLDLVGETLSNE